MDDRASGGQEPAGEDIAVLRRVSSLDLVECIGLEAVCDRGHGAVHAGRNRVGRLFRLPLGSQGHVDARHLEGIVCLIDSAAKAGAPACEDEALLGEGIFRNGDECVCDILRSGRSRAFGAVQVIGDGILGGVGLPDSGHLDIKFRHGVSGRCFIDLAVHIALPANEGIAFLAQSILQQDQRASHALLRADVSVAVHEHDGVLGRVLLPLGGQGDVSIRHDEGVAPLIDPALMAGSPAGEGVAGLRRVVLHDIDDAADPIFDRCRRHSGLNAVLIGNIVLDSRDNLFPDSRQGDVGVGHDELVAGLHDFVADCDVASPALEDVLRLIKARRRVCDDNFAEDIDIRSVRGIALCADVGQLLRHVLPLGIERDLALALSSQVADLLLVGIGCAGAVSRGVPAAEDVELHAVLLVGAGERVRVQLGLDIIGEGLIFHRTGDSLAAGVGVKDHSIFDGLPLDVVIRVVFRHVCSRIKCIAVCIEPLDEGIALAGGRGNLHIVGDLRGVVLVLHLTGFITVLERQNYAVRHLAHIVLACFDRLCRPDVRLLCACVGGYFRLCYFESPLDRILAQHVVSAWAARKALVVASLCASFSKLIHLERSNVAAANGLSTAVLLLFNRHNVIFVHERYHETIGARGGLTVHTGCLDHVGASVNKFRDLIEGGRRVGDKHHIVNAEGLRLKIPLAAVIGELPVQLICAVEAVPVNGERVCVIRHGVFGSADLLRFVFFGRNRRIETILDIIVSHRVEALNGDQAIRKVSLGRLGDMIHPFCIVSLTSFNSGHFFAVASRIRIPAQEEAALFFRRSQLARRFKHGVSGEGTAVGDSVNEISIVLLDQPSNVRICCVYNGCGRIRMSFIVVIVMTVELSNSLQRRFCTVRHVNDFQCALAKEHHTTDRGHALTERYLF